MSFASLNAVNASRGLQGTNRQTAATFAGSGAPLAAPPQGMAGGMAQAIQQIGGSSYTKGMGMGAVGSPTGVVPGQQVASAVPYQAPTQMTQAEMQDPNNAAMAGFQFAQSQDRPASAPTGAAQAPPPQTFAPGAQPVPQPGLAQVQTGQGNITKVLNNPAKVTQGMPILPNRQVM